jgi:NADPH-dependent curcumin reductase CurA
MIMHQRWTLARRPQGLPQADDFRLEQSPLPELKDGQVLVRTDFVSVDPGMRPRLTGDTYAAAATIGSTIESAGIGTVIVSRNPKYDEGAKVWGGFGWQSHVLSEGRGMQKLDPAIYCGPVHETCAIGVLGIPGLTALFGLAELGKPKEGETVLVSSAAGTVGATAGQIAKIEHCSAVGLAGSDAKCTYLREIGFDHAINYKTCGDLAAAIKQAAPKGVDIYFDNVGGETLDAAIVNMRQNGRIVVSGQTAEYNIDKPRGIRNTLPFISQRLRMEGFVVYDYAPKFNEARAQLAHWIRHGKLKFREEIVDGLENAPSAFRDLFTGETFGRRLVRVSNG